MPYPRGQSCHPIPTPLLLDNCKNLPITSQRRVWLAKIEKRRSRVSDHALHHLNDGEVHQQPVYITAVQPAAILEGLEKL